MSPEKQISGFLAKYDPVVRKEAVKARAALRKRMPTAIEMVYDNYNALVFGFVPSERVSDVVMSIAVYPRWVTLFFLQGAPLNDPEGLLQGSGKIVRSIRLASAADLRKPAVKALIDQALLRAEVPMPKSGSGATVIKSISAKQRPRRPS